MLYFVLKKLIIKVVFISKTKHTANIVFITKTKQNSSHSCSSVATKKVQNKPEYSHLNENKQMSRTRKKNKK